MANAVGPFRPARQNKVPIHNTWTPPVPRTAVSNVRTFSAHTRFVPPTPTGVRNTMTGQRTIKVQKNFARLPAAARPNAAATAPKGR